MKIASVKLVNFLSHEDTLVRFSEGVNVIVGQNGAGKSSVVDAILFALFRTPSRGGIGELLRRGTRRGLVELSMFEGDVTYKVRRELTSNNPQDLLMRNNEPIHRSARGVTAGIRDLLKVDENVLTSTVFVRQGRIEDVFDSLGEVMTFLLRLDRIEKLVSTNGPIRALQQKVEADLKIAEERMKRREELTRRRKDLEVQLSKGEEELMVSESELREVRRTLDDYRKKRDTLLGLQSKYVTLSSDVERLLKKISELEVELSEVKTSLPSDEKIEALRRKVEELSKVNELKLKLQNFKNLEDAGSTLSSQLRTLKTQLSNLEVRAARRVQLEAKARQYEELREALNKLNGEYMEYTRLEAALKQLEEKEKTTSAVAERLSTELESMPGEREISSEISNLRERESELSSELKYLYTKRNELKERLSKIRGEVCPVCGRPLDEEHKRRLKSEAEDELLSLDAREVELNDELSWTRARVKELEKQREKVSVLLNQLQSSKAELELVLKRKREISDQMEKLEPLAKKFEELSSKEKELRAIHDEFLRLSDSTEEEVQRVKRQVEALEMKLRDNLAKQEGLKSELQGIDERYVEMMERELRNAQTQLDRLQELKQRAYLLSQSVEDYRRQLEVKEEELRSLNYTPLELEKVKEEVARLEERERKLTEVTFSLRGQNEERRRELGQISEELRNLEVAAEDVKRLRVAYERLNRLRTVLGQSKLKGYLITRAKDILDYHLNSVVKEFNLGFSNFEVVNDDGKFSVRAYRPDRQWVDVRALSGGERVALAISLRLALARMASQEIGFMVMDEPTIHLDESRRSELVDIVRNAVSIVPQLIVVTHDRELETAGDNIIEVVNDGRSKVLERRPQEARFE
ncbi:hypothetical protein HS1genome_0704 [Sulfodiicoccus acidiphilus]|uniref:DNA double-strand break repair Rad50 ATPase n=1 Tax=Sulfodiicoccus acidiphilus TaxID=1670455 RepID=A0A348B2B3_9CREN|nr:ATP-binding protein [Sulfodiicoccus acidiphilus]BBD72315.1 hypothetical protein HS1genome_0704 [Sulfodiicoccus acidiphilus]GGT90323.1 hypothetical protein GCM10007116_05160 [Sulfodiicoccus acidiphilus]